MKIQLQSHPAVKLMRSFAKIFPRTDVALEEFKRLRAKQELHWPSWCFLPLHCWRHLVEIELEESGKRPEIQGMQPFNGVGSLTVAAAALLTWRYSQGIYQFHPDVLAEVAASSVAGPIPCEVLYRLPEWCIYVETPGFESLFGPVRGFWAHLEYDLPRQRSELRLVVHTDKNLQPIALQMGAWTIDEAVKKLVDEALQVNQSIGAIRPDLAEKLTQRLENEGQTLVSDISTWVTPMISLLLFLCSDEPEIDDDRQPGLTPKKAEPQRTKLGFKLFPAENFRIWQVGQRLGRQLADP